MPVSLCIVEDDTLHLERLRLLLGEEPDFNVVGFHTSVDDTLMWLKSHMPDVLLTDIRLPVKSGIVLIQEVSRHYPNLPVIALTSAVDNATIEHALKAGARGYILKTEPAGKICKMVRDFLSDGVTLSSKPASYLIHRLQSEDPSATRVTLSPRERNILIEADKGATYKETAERFGVSLHTIHNQVQKIFEKLEVKKKEDAINKARMNGLI